MDNCEISKNVTGGGWQSTELNWCHFSTVETQKSFTLDKKDILSLRIKMNFPNKFMNSVTTKYHACCVLNSFVSNYWGENRVLWLPNVLCLKVSIYSI